MTVAVGVVAHHTRLVKAWDMAQLVQASFLSVDHGAWGSTANHLKVWRHLVTDYLTAMDRCPREPFAGVPQWLVVLEDDAVPCEDFRHQLDAALASAPGDIVGLYLGTGYPTAWQDFIKHAELDPAHWTQTHSLLHGVATAIRTELVPSMLEWVGAQRDQPIDEAITQWARAHAHVVSYTRPSIIDHADWPTLINHPDMEERENPRHAWQFGTRENWKSTTVWIP